ncbi:MAG TPA: N-acetylmuramoyl-L-alanine amidase-like domain-containing protein [Kamptonema sp.]|nr:N-acetylmuramoyl-L-alanine amidase-like domain-containing protein [Kamptonema sp.]
MKRFLRLTLLGFGAAIAGGGTCYFTPLFLVVHPQVIAAVPTINQTIAKPILPGVRSIPKVEGYVNSEGISRIPELARVEDLERFDRVVKYSRSQKLHDRSMEGIMQAIADNFLGTPYKAGLLDKSNEEKLVVSLDGFDCVLFVETVLAIARGVAVQDYAYQTFLERLENQRYSDGKMNGYCSRLHYFSEWIEENQKRGTVQNITSELGGIPLKKKLNFMSKHSGSYPQLANNETNYNCIVEQEADLAKLTINYLPLNQIKSVYSQLKAGDIVAVATDIDGLDVTHTGLVYRNADGNIGLIHASPIGEVTIAYDLHRYIGRVESAIGIVVARPIDPR